MHTKNKTLEISRLLIVAGSLYVTIGCNSNKEVAVPQMHFEISKMSYKPTIASPKPFTALQIINRSQSRCTSMQLTFDAYYTGRIMDADGPFYTKLNADLEKDSSIEIMNSPELHWSNKLPFQDKQGRRLSGLWSANKLVISCNEGSEEHTLSF